MINEIRNVLEREKKKERICQVTVTSISLQLGAVSVRYNNAVIVTKHVCRLQPIQ